MSRKLAPSAGDLPAVERASNHFGEFVDKKVQLSKHLWHRAGRIQALSEYTLFMDSGPIWHILF
jgi:hypothetical protein